jgi:hypothetical protein
MPPVDPRVPIHDLQHCLEIVTKVECEDKRPSTQQGAECRRAAHPDQRERFGQSRPSGNFWRIRAIESLICCSSRRWLGVPLAHDFARESGSRAAENVTVAGNLPRARLHVSRRTRGNTGQWRGRSRHARRFAANGCCRCSLLQNRLVHREASPHGARHVGG